MTSNLFKVHTHLDLRSNSSQSFHDSRRPPTAFSEQTTNSWSNFGVVLYSLTAHTNSLPKSLEYQMECINLNQLELERKKNGRALFKFWDILGNRSTFNVGSSCYFYLILTPAIQVKIRTDSAESGSYGP